MGKIKKVKKKGTQDFFTNKLATLLLVQSKLLPPEAIGLKELDDKI